MKELQMSGKSIHLDVWVKALSILLLLMLLTRIFFFIELKIVGDYPWISGLYVIKGIVVDIWLCGRIFVFLFIPFIILNFFAPKAEKPVYYIILILYVLINIVLTTYFLNTNRPLDHVLYAYSYSDLKETVFASLEFKLSHFLFPVLYSLSAFLLFKFLNRLNFKRVYFYIFSILGIVTVFIPKSIFVESEKNYPDENAYFMSVNQMAYTIHQLIINRNSFKYEWNRDDIKRAAEDYQALFPEYDYPFREYPFMRTPDKNDVLGGFFYKTSDTVPPNFVFIIIEGFGQELTGIYPTTISFTPFIDSLKTKSLYWENCLSTAERTFGVLPGIFASAPYGKKGFGNIYEPIPEHQSLLKDFVANGYMTSFFYGGSASFDGQDVFMKNNLVSYILENDMNEEKMDQNLIDNNRWGLDDKEMFEKALEYKTKMGFNRHCVDVYLTLTTHEPFIFNGMQPYLIKVENMLKSHEFENEQEKKNIDKHKKVFACYLYMDDCVRKLISGYKKHESFDNTIFILTGDHRTANLLNSNPLQKYHIPLIVYSPLLKENKKMQAVVSHLDIAPSLSLYLNSNYDYKIHKYCHWTGTILDTSVSFSCRKKMAFMLNNRDVTDYMKDRYFISNGHLYKIEKDLQTIPFNDDKKLEELKKNLGDYQCISTYSVHNNCLYFNENNHRKLLSRQYNATNQILKSDAEFNYLVDDIVVQDNYKQLDLEISFKFSPAEKFPFLVLSAEDFYYLKIDLNEDKENIHKVGKEKIYQLKTVIPLNSRKGDVLFKVYLWNPNNNAIIKYKDIKYVLYGS